MELKYDGRKFIGAIKFFDKTKNFGYVASNRCGMNDDESSETVIKTDFYIDSSSFLNGTPEDERTVVVFQIQKQDRLKSKAVNVRPITQSDEDAELALNYYGEYETVMLKNLASEFNIFAHCHVPISKLLPYVIKKIGENENRNASSTLSIVQDMICHFATKEKKYVFDYDCDNDGKDTWLPFFGSLTSDEMLEVVKRYPTTIKYVSNQDIFQAWLDSLKNDDGEYDISTLFTLKSVLGSIQISENEARLRQIIDENADYLAENIEKEFSSYASLNEYVINNEINKLNNLTGKNYNYILTRCKEAFAKRDFLTFLESFKKYGYDSDKLIAAYQKMSESSQEEYAEDFRTAVEERLNILLDKNIWHLFSLLEKYSFWGRDFINPFYEKALPIAKGVVIEPLMQDVNDLKKISEFKGSIYKLHQAYPDQSFDELKAEAKTLLLQTTSVFALNNIIEFDFISRDEVFERLKVVIDNWNFTDVDSYFYPERIQLEDDPAFRQLVIDKIFEIIDSKQLSELYDESDTLTYRVSDACSFLKVFHDLIKRDGRENYEDHWNKYVQSCDFKFKLDLLRNEVISRPPQDVIEGIINNLTKDDFYNVSGGWPISYSYDGYKRAKLKDSEQANLLKSSKDLFACLQKRLIGMDVVRENVALVVHLLELVQLKCPNSPDFYERREWNQQLTSFINRIISYRSNDARIKTILWAVFFQSSASLAALTEIFSEFPPYIQIKAVKKLFQLIDQGKLNLDAESLYKLLEGGVRPLCFPLEITFAYLRIRTKDPYAALTNNIMLELLDGRDDHKEWEKITMLMHQCQGRIHVIDGEKRDQLRRFHNGTVKVTGNRIEVYIPKKMCDIDGKPQEYNNKYFKSIKEYVMINFGAGAPQPMEYNDAYEYYFNKNQHIEVLNMARAFNLCYRDRYEMPIEYTVYKNETHKFCEVRQALELDREKGEPFYWCAGYPCFRDPVRFMVNDEWENYTILDFMRILQIPVDYVSIRTGNETRFGHYIIFSSYMLSFKKFYDHLFCRSCKKLMRPHQITNFESRAVNKFSCANKDCENFGQIVYLNHCFNTKNCNATIDSRDSKQCPNEQYICPECGACCSTQNFARRLDNLRLNGGEISPGLVYFVNHDLGHWEKKEFYCYKCGKKLVNGKCPDCGTTY